MSIRDDLRDHIDDGCAVHSTDHILDLISDTILRWLDAHDCVVAENPSRELADMWLEEMSA